MDTHCVLSGFNVYTATLIEVDGRFGDYAECNQSDPYHCARTVRLMLLKFSWIATSACCAWWLMLGGCR